MYLDDVIKLSTSVEENVAHVDEVLSLLCAAGIYLNLSKWSFCKDRAYYLGNVVLPGMLDDSDRASEAARRVPFPAEKTKLKSFLGIFNANWRFVAQFFKVGRWLRTMINKYS